MQFQRQVDDLLLNFLVFHTTGIGYAIGVHLHRNVEFVAPIEDATGKCHLDQFIVAKLLLERLPEVTRNRVGISCNAFGQLHSQCLTRSEVGCIAAKDCIFLWFDLVAHGVRAYGVSIRAVIDLAGLEAHHLKDVWLNAATAEEALEHRDDAVEQWWNSTDNAEHLRILPPPFAGLCQPFVDPGIGGLSLQDRLNSRSHYLTPSLPGRYGQDPTDPDHEQR